MSNSDIMDHQSLMPFPSVIPCLPLREKTLEKCEVDKWLIGSMKTAAEIAKLNKKHDEGRWLELMSKLTKQNACTPIQSAEARKLYEEIGELTTTCSKHDIKNMMNQYNSCMNCYTPIPTPTTFELSTGAIAGIVVSSVILLALIIFLIWYVSKHNHKHR